MFQPNKNSGHKKLNKYLKEIGCPTWWREHIPLVYINGELVAVADIGVSARFSAVSAASAEVVGSINIQLK
jgi:tRNA(Ile)-lysidine synthase